MRRETTLSDEGIAMIDQSVNDAAPWTAEDPCPEWCTGNHIEEEHAEDRAHYSETLSFPVVIPAGQPYRKDGVECAEFMVGMRQYEGDGETWVFIGNSEDTTMSIEVTLESARRLSRILVQLVK